MSVIDFLIALRREVSIFTENTADNERLSNEERRLACLSQDLVVAYYKLIEFYFRDINIPGDENFFTESEIQVAIDKLNNIMKTYLHTDFS